ncbi:MAG TPA: tRNA (guanosine(37)-N1)-methyltransferase TrmD [Desulfotomaculum sp.]|nr:tRNA (guanosine(37)-N1)-methyltransferase TrmD [Desulfotomaculum sp.]
MVFDILTLFPAMFAGPFSTSILKRAIDKGIIAINLINIRDFSQNRHRTVDDAPFGGGAGMVMEPEPIFRALEAVREAGGGKPGPVILLCPQGERFTQSLAQALAAEKRVVLICGHYEGVDERVRSAATGEISVGDFVLTGGELAAMVVVDAVSRLVPGVLGEETAPAADSFATGLLEHPQYTRPREYRGTAVPEVLLSGHHARIARWRREEALIRTLVRRPELLSTAELTDEDRSFLRECATRIDRLLIKE